MDKKLGIIVPYRDRYEQLITFKDSIGEFLKNINYEIIIVEQDDAKIFNRGKLLNIGFIEAKKLKCDYVVFHDVDMIPVDVDYSYSPYPIHLSNNFIPNDVRIVFDEYFGGVTLFPIELFEMINGYSNEYWGWGYEDTDLLYRCKVANIELDKKEIEQSGGNTASIKLNGSSSHIIGDNSIFRDNSKLTILISFCLNDITLNHEKYDDTFTIFSNENIKIKYTSYQMYHFEINNTNYITTSVQPTYKTNLCVTIDMENNEFALYQDGELIEYKTIDGDIDFNGDSFFIGSEGDKNFFNGQITSFAVYSKILKDNEIIEISKNQYFGLTQQFGRYKSSNNLICYYDGKVTKDKKIIDLSDNKNDGDLHNCTLTGFTYDDVKIIEIPFRRQGTFKLLPHDENGFVNGAWKNINTRYNQLRYFNEVIKGCNNIKEDGLNNCEYKIHDKNKVNNLTHIVVGI